MDNNLLTVLDLLRRSINESNWEYVETSIAILEEGDYSGYDTSYYGEEDYED